MLDVLDSINKLDFLKEIKLKLSSRNIPTNFAKHIIDTCNLIRSLESFQSASRLITEYSGFKWDNTLLKLRVSEMNNLIDMSHFENTYYSKPAVDMFKELCLKINSSNLTSEEEYLKGILKINIDLMINNLHFHTPIIFIKRSNKLELVDGMHRITAKIIKSYEDTGIDFSNLEVSIPVFLGIKIDA